MGKVTQRKGRATRAASGPADSPPRLRGSAPPKVPRIAPAIPPALRNALRVCVLLCAVNAGNRVLHWALTQHVPRTLHASQPTGASGPGVQRGGLQPAVAAAREPAGDFARAAAAAPLQQWQLPIRPAAGKHMQSAARRERLQYKYIYTQPTLMLERVVVKLQFIAALVEQLHAAKLKQRHLKYGDFLEQVQEFAPEGLAEEVSTHCEHECMARVAELEDFVDAFGWFSLGYNWRAYNALKGQLLEDQGFTYLMVNIHREWLLLNKCFEGQLMSGGLEDPRVPLWEPCSPEGCRLFPRPVIHDRTAEVEAAALQLADMEACGFMCIVYRHMNRHLSYPHSPAMAGFDHMVAELLPHCDYHNNWCRGLLADEVTASIMDLRALSDPERQELTFVQLTRQFWGLCFDFTSVIGFWAVAWEVARACQRCCMRLLAAVWQCRAQRVGAQGGVPARRSRAPGKPSTPPNTPGASPIKPAALPRTPGSASCSSPRGASPRAPLAAQPPAQREAVVPPLKLSPPQPAPRERSPPRHEAPQPQPHTPPQRAQRPLLSPALCASTSSSSSSSSAGAHGGSSSSSSSECASPTSPLSDAAQTSASSPPPSQCASPRAAAPPRYAAAAAATVAGMPPATHLLLQEATVQGLGLMQGSSALLLQRPLHGGPPSQPLQRVPAPRLPWSDRRLPMVHAATATAWTPVQPPPPPDGRAGNPAEEPASVASRQSEERWHMDSLVHSMVDSLLEDGGLPETQCTQGPTLPQPGTPPSAPLHDTWPVTSVASYAAVARGRAQQGWP